MRSLIDRGAYRVALWRLGRRPGVRLGRDARVDARAITAHPDCRLEIGERTIVEAHIDLEREGAVLTVGRNCYVGASMFKCAARIEIGDDVEIAWDCTIVDHDWEPLAWARRTVDMRGWYRAPKDWTHVAVAPVRIGDRALVHLGAIILKGVSVGEGAVVGAGSVVTRDVPAWTVVAGNPARIIRELPPAERSPVAPAAGAGRP
jgi:acetyltransferase-like isoleucine patch superfamily enzyme